LQGLSGQNIFNEDKTSLQSLTRAAIMSLFEGGMDKVDLVITLFEVVVVLLGVVGLPILTKMMTTWHTVYIRPRSVSQYTRDVYGVWHSADFIGKSN